ncbi:MAG: hypothetical protein JST51_02210 [Armatimonadetes bacterium]|nr:hypothetical protein [Armatimonadota bacterium]
MSFDIPPNIEPQVKEFAQAQHISETEALIRLIQAGLSVQKIPPQETVRPSYGSMFGILKNGYGSPEAVDKAIDEIRDAW